MTGHPDRVGGLDLVPALCPLCGQNHGQHLWSFQPRDIGETFRVDLCPACGQGYVQPRPSARELARYFSDPVRFMATTDPEGQPRSLMLERDRRKKEYQGYVRRLRRMVPAGGRILDVGSGLGLFLELMGPEYHRQGIEINPAAARVTRERLGIPVWETDAGSVDFPPASLDLVAFMQTIDHLDQPGGMIERSAQWLKPGGILFLSALINVRSPMARLFGGDFRLLHPFHLAYFNPARFSRLVRRHGLKPVHREYPYFRTEWFTPRMAAGSLLKTAARAFGTRKEPSPPFYGNTFNLVAVKEGW